MEDLLCRPRLQRLVALSTTASFICSFLLAPTENVLTARIIWQSEHYFARLHAYFIVIIPFITYSLCAREHPV